MTDTAIIDDRLTDPAARDCLTCGRCGGRFVYWFECEDDGCCPHCGTDA